ncbi:MAG: Ppx/GppA family phosphatase, partial [Oceanicaulis sp.]|nr:Ppx/GppA family phosphatase [Oceanicaulis sp.]
MAKDAAGAESPKPRPDGAHRRRSADPVYGAIDLGTTNCRMLLACKTQHGFRVIDAYSRIVRLGEGLLSTGQLSEPAMTRALEALSVCADRLKRRNVTRMRAIATEACRVAINGPEFLARAKELTGLDLEIITAEEEARLAVQGSLDLLDPEHDAAVVLDIGGGSTELCWVDL